MPVWKIHAGLVHFPIALVFLAFVFGVIGFAARSESFARAGRYVIIAGLIGGILAIGSGIWNLLNWGPVGDVGDLAHDHMLSGIVTGVAVLVQSIWAFAARRGMSRGAEAAYLVLSLVSAVLALYTGFIGGELSEKFPSRIQQGGL